VAVADFLHPPEIQSIDLSSYHGAPNQPITITAVDDVKVKSEGVMIVNDDGTLVEKGTAIAAPEAANQWLYNSTAAAGSESVKIVVDVADLAGQVAEVTQHT
jgi:hypoxanthine-guanine phosphoribosyltransferase